MVRNLTSPRSGREVPNQFEIITNNGVFFQSYRSVVARVCNGQITLSQHWDYSNTTRKYLYEFLRENGFRYTNWSADYIRKEIANGHIILVETNSISM